MCHQSFGKTFHYMTNEHILDSTNALVTYRMVLKDGHHSIARGRQILYTKGFLAVELCVYLF